MDIEEIRSKLLDRKGLSEAIAQIELLIGASGLSIISPLLNHIEAQDAKLNYNRCNSGHETLPLVLWTCPACHDKVQQERATYKKFFDKMVEAFNGSSAGEVDALEFEDIAEELGLIRWLTFDDTNEDMVAFVMAAEIEYIENGDRFWYVKGTEPKLDALEGAEDE